MTFSKQCSRPGEGSVPSCSMGLLNYGNRSLSRNLMFCLLFKLSCGAAMPQANCISQPRSTQSNMRQNDSSICSPCQVSKQYIPRKHQLRLYLGIIPLMVGNSPSECLLTKGGWESHAERRVRQLNPYSRFLWTEGCLKVVNKMNVERESLFLPTFLSCERQ